jgi:hypothetical protein
MTLDVSVPDMIVAFTPICANVPTNDHFLPVADATVVVAKLAAGNTGAVKRYTLPSHTFVVTTAIAVAAVITGATGTVVTVLVNLSAVALLSPHNDVYINLTLSPVAAAALLLN